MAHVTFIHGILNKPPSDVLLAQWCADLATNAGIDLAGAGCTTRMVYWADVLYDQPEVVGAQESLAAEFEIESGVLRQVASVADSSQEESQFIAGLAGKFAAVSIRATAAEGISPPASSVGAEVVPLPWSVKGPLMACFLRDVHHYLFNANFSPRPGVRYDVQDEIRRRFVDALRDPRARGTRHLVVSHSMGTVIAYDCLKRVPGCPAVDELLTVGSPLGLDEIRQKLEPEWTATQGFPWNTLRGAWANVFDRLDPVCGFAPHLAPEYQRDGCQVVSDNAQINSGWWRHDIAKYLGGDVLRRAFRRQLALVQPTIIIPSESQAPQSIAGPTLPAQPDRPAFGKRAPLSSPSPQAADGGAGDPRMHSQTSEGAEEPSLDDLIAACQSYDRARVNEICGRWADQLTHHRLVLDESGGTIALKQLRRKCYLKELATLADALLDAHVETPQIRRLYAQSLIDSARFVPAELILKDVIASCKDKNEQAECRGLLGRIHKQRYVNAPGDRSRDQRRHLTAALDWYYGVFKQQPDAYVWHGINVVALAARARRDGVPLEDYPKPEDLACRLLGQLAADQQRAGNLNAWELASTLEAYVALGDMERALEFAKAYVACPEADAFELNSSLRQLTEVWQLEPDGGPTGMLLMLLRAELLKRHGGQISVSRQEMPGHFGPWAAQDLQRVFGADKYQTLEWYRRGLLRTMAVGRFETATGRKVGTGFIVNAKKTLCEDWTDEYVLLTNAHVVSNEDMVLTALRPRDAFVTFESWEKAKGRYRVGDVLWTSAEFDATVVRLDPPLEGCGACDDFASPPEANGQTRVYMIGYPLGGGLAISLNDNLLLGYRDPRLHYRTPSDPGSSGSPVFDDEWRLIALHHAGSPTMRKLDGSGVYEANEGISVDAIRGAIAKANGNSVRPPESSRIPTEKPSASRGRNKIVTCADIRALLGGSLDAAAGDGTESQSAAGAAAGAVLKALSEEFPKKSDRDAIVKQLKLALRQLRDEAADHETQILFSPTNRLAALLQSTLAGNLPPADAKLEFAFDSKDTKEVLKEFFEHAKNVQKHAPMRPATAQPAALSDNARLFLVSDFGTGLYGALRISQTISASSTNYDLLLHLGDIYYSGQPDEVRDRFLSIWPEAKGRISRTLNGNHDMYSGGSGYFDVALHEFAQPSSYFAFQNRHWTLICLDTSYKDNDLDEEQVDWVKAVVEQAEERGIVLFSHHPLFSNFKEPGEKLEKKLKKFLRRQRIAAWYWGHEHHCVLYDRHPDYMFYGRCLGHGGMPSKRKRFEGMSPVEQLGDFTWREKTDGATPAARYLDGPNPYIPGHEEKYAPHGYMTLEFSGKQMTEACCSAEGEVLHSMSISA